MKWKTIKESKKYKVNKLGEVLGPSGKILNPTMMKMGYFSVAISLGNRKVKRQYVHILVAEAFIGKIPNNYIVNHKDNNKINNKLENLEIVTRSENTKQWRAINNHNKKHKLIDPNICSRGHNRKNDRKYLYCYECVRLKKSGIIFIPPSDTTWKKSILPNYLISKDGRVWSTKSNKIMKKVKNLDGYIAAALYENKKTIRITVHKLVAIAFIGPIKKSYVVDHIDGNKENNNVENLRINKQSDNMKFARKRMIKNGNHGFKLTENNVIEIKTILKDKSMSIKCIAEKFSVSISIIYDIRAGNKWKHINV